MKYDDCMNEYRKNYQAKKYKEALKFAKKGIDIDPSKYEGWAILGNLYLLDLQKPDDALHIVKRALVKIHANNPNLLEIQAQAQFKLGQYKACFDTLNQILKVDPDNSNLWDIMDKLYATEKSLRQNIDTIRNKTYKEYLDKARNYNLLNKLDDALTYFQKAILIIPSSIEVNEDLARLYYSKKNYNASLSYVNQLLITKPNDLSLINLKAYNLWALGQREDAYDLFTKSLKTKSNQNTIISDMEKLQLELASIYNNEGDSKFRLSEFEEAIKQYQQTLHYHKGDTYALQKITEVQQAIQKHIEQRKEQETEQLLQYLANEAQTNDEILIQDIVREMPPHEDVKDEASLRSLLKQLILNQRISGALTPTSIKFSRGSASIVINNNQKNATPSQRGHQQYQTILLKQSTLPVIILREGNIDASGYHFTVKIKNNQQFPIRDVHIYILFPQDCLNLKTPNPQIISIIHPGQIQEKNFDFHLTQTIIDGVIHTAVFNLDSKGELNMYSVSGFQIENVTCTIKPLQLDSQRLPQILQQCQQYPVTQEKFTLNQIPSQAFRSIQGELQAMHFFILKSIDSDTNGKYSGYIYASGMPSAVNDPIFIEIQLDGISTQNSTEVSVSTKTATARLSKIVTNTVKGSLIMPKCQVCDQVFPLSLYSKLKKNEKVICEFCGSPFQQNQPTA